MEYLVTHYLQREAELERERQLRRRMAGHEHDARKTPPEQVREDKDARESHSEKQIDKELQDTFPASDPVSKY